MTKILIAEDDENSRVFLESLLVGNGYEVDIAENGKVALKLVRLCPPDLIISDILMPEMDGYEFCRAVKKDEKFCLIPFVFYTATYTDPDDEKLALDLGAERFLVKPMEIDALLLEIQLLLKKKTEEKQHNSEQTIKNEHYLNKEYAQVLSKKLDKKVQQLEKSEQKYRNLVEVLRDNYFLYTRDNNNLFTYISPSIKNVLGYTQEEFLDPFAKFLSDSAINKAAEICIKNSNNGIKQPPYEVEIYHRNNEIHQLEFTEEPVIDKNGEVLTIDGIAHDITQRISAEKQLAKANEHLRQSQKMEAIGTLAGGIAHDFNNLLTPIIGYTEMTQMNLSQDSKDWKNLQSVLSAANRAKDLVAQILTFSRYTETETTPLLLQTVIRDSLKLLRPSIPSTIEIQTSIDPDCSPISANQTQMHQIIMNLCTNAYYAMHDHGGVLSISLTMIDVNSDNTTIHLDLNHEKYAKLEISDTGTGIEKSRLERIFEPYFTTKLTNGGTGLGLSVVHGIVCSHNGKITVESEPGQGTTFNIYLPNISESPVDEDIIINEMSTGSEQILLVDDDKIIGNMVQEQLELLGYKTEVVTSGKQAIDFLSKAPGNIDMVITDMTMPHMTGAQLSEELLKIDPEILIIICTGFSDLIDKEKAIAMGIKAFLMKPVSLQEFANTVRKVFDDNQNEKYELPEIHKPVV